MKYCAKCNQRKSHKQFSKDASKFDGLRTICVTCDREASREWYEDKGRDRRYPHLTLADAAAA